MGSRYAGLAFSNSKQILRLSFGLQKIIIYNSYCVHVGWKQNDITDSVYWAIAEGYADKERVGITGISFGGFCTLAGITFTPGIHCMAVDFSSEVMQKFESL